jgi:hypothetical protein
LFRPLEFSGQKASWERPKDQLNHLRISATGHAAYRQHVIAASYAFRGFQFRKSCRKSYTHASLQDFNAGFG